MLLFLCSARHACAAHYTLLGWNNLGMHCMDADYSVFALLPPYNTIHAQLIDPQGRLVGDPAGIMVTYEAVADPDGSVNTTSAGKTTFWDHVQALFRVSRPVDVGLADQRMPGASNQPQPMEFDAATASFAAEGIPITPYDDAGQTNSYPLMRLVARDSLGAMLATTDIVLPVSDEMDCKSCHASGSSAAAQPSEGWVNNPDPQRDMRLNILRLHDEREGGTDAFQNALTAAGYNPAGLFATATGGGTAILCARCHRSEALSGSGLPGIEPLTQAVHRRMAATVDPLTGLVLGAIDNRSACYRCHPGSTTRCLRGAMANAVAADGSRVIQCQSCHGSMLDVASPARNGWLDEPACQSCHTGTATHNNGAVRYTSAFEAAGQPRAAVDQTFATNTTSGQALYRFSTGHGGLACEACHGSTHAEFPSAQRNDNLQSLATQGHAGTLVECDRCHGSVPTAASGGPHGMHPVGQQWVNSHPDVVGEEGGGSATQCQACHGIDYRGTVLSRVQADRALNAGELGSKDFWRGFEVGCYTCHLGPGNSDPNFNRPPTAGDAAAATAQDTPVVVPLSATDPDGNALTLRVVSQPSHGTAGLVGTTAQYFPDMGFTGADAFTFAARDGSTDSNLGTVSLTVSALTGCVGDCNGSGMVTIDELVTGVDMALNDLPSSHCPAFDANGDGRIRVEELVMAVNAALGGCAVITPTPNLGSPTVTPTPTATPTTGASSPTPSPTSSGATLANIQATIFSTTCTDAACHSSLAQAGNLVLEAGMSFSQLVNAPPFNFAAQQAGLLRVKPGDPDNSFLTIKLTGPSLPQGSPMPLGKPPLSAAQIQLIRDWITAGAPN
jgi:Big-like domain-containing protein